MPNINDLKVAYRNYRARQHPTGYGPLHEGNGLWADPKPYKAVHSNGMFEGYDNSVWLYFGFPHDVKIDWVPQSSDIVFNQRFLNDVFESIGSRLSSQLNKTRRDKRRDFHIQLTQDKYPGIRPAPGSTPAKISYLERISLKYDKAEWFGYMGFKLEESSPLYDAYGWREKAHEWWNALRYPDETGLSFFREDIEFLNGIMTRAGFRPLNFVEPNAFDPTIPGARDYEQLTAWNGIEDERFGKARELENIRSAAPVHGESIIVPKTWGSKERPYSELSFHAVRPVEGMFMTDPESTMSQWATSLLAPMANTAAVSIRGQVRAPNVAMNVLDQKRENSERRADKQSSRKGNKYGSVDQRVASDASKLKVSQDMISSSSMPYLDNVEIIVGTLVTERPSELPSLLERHNLKSVPLIGRQAQALNSTYPTYPRPLFRVRRGNATRDQLTNQMLPGILTFSGVMKNIRPAESSGIFMGLSYGDTQYQEIYTSIDSAYRNSSVPGMLITGRPGAGKTQTMLQMVEQVIYDGYSAFYLNPKRDATLQPVFDHLGGVTISMSSRFLDDNPGCYDPIFYFDGMVKDDGTSNYAKEMRLSRIKVAETLSNAIFMALKWYYVTENVAENEKRMAEITADIRRNAIDMNNKCSYDIIFGNERVGTKPIESEMVRDFVARRMETSPFWKAFIARSNVGSDLQQRMMQNKAVLVEWDGSLTLPSNDDPPANYKPSEIDSILSVQTTFMYAVNILGNGRSGGMLAVDESWVLKGSKEIKSILNAGFREWRQSNILLLMGTQRISDWMGGTLSEDDMTTFFARILMMALTKNDDAERDLFYKFSGLERKERYTRFIENAGVNKNRPDIPPRGYYVDNITGWYGPIITGPYPDLELNLGRSDAEGEAARKASELEKKRLNSEMYGGAIADVMEEDMQAGLMDEKGEWVDEEPYEDDETGLILSNRDIIEEEEEQDDLEHLDNTEGPSLEESLRQEDGSVHTSTPSPSGSGSTTPKSADQKPDFDAL